MMTGHRSGANPQTLTTSIEVLATSMEGRRPIKSFHGRQKGDVVLQQLIADGKPLPHAKDELFRIGGSEFLLPLRDHRLDSARSRLEMSAGMSLLGASDTTGEAMLSRVVLALNHPGDLGGHQVMVR